MSGFWFYFVLGLVQSAGLMFSVMGLWRVRRRPGALRTSFYVTIPLWALLLAWTLYASGGGRL